jgi:hypothetical protein
MRKFTFGFITGIVIVLAVQSQPMTPVRETVKEYVVSQTTRFLDDFVDAYVDEREKIKLKDELKKEATTQEGQA